MLLLIDCIFHSGKNLFSVEENYFQLRCISFISLRSDFPLSLVYFFLFPYYRDFQAYLGPKV